MQSDFRQGKIMADVYVQSQISIERNHREIHAKNIKECMQEYSKTKPDTEAFVFVSTDGGRQSLTWSMLYERSCAVASSFIQLGVKRKEIVAIDLRTCPEWLYATFGAMIAGAIPVSVSFTYMDGSDLVALMQKLQCCSLLIMDPGLDSVNWNIVKNILDEQNGTGAVKSIKLPYLRYLIGVGFENCTEQVKSFHDFVIGAGSDTTFPDIASDDIATMLQTSGSTGVPKLVVHTHKALITMTRSNLAMLDPRHLVFNDRPFTWFGGFPFSVLIGQSRITVSGFCKAPTNRVSFMKEIIEKEKCSIIVALPVLLAELIRIQDELPSVWPVEGILTGGQPLTKTLAESIRHVGKFLCCLYGSSEAMILTQSVVEDPDNFTEYACGLPLQLRGIEMKVVDEIGKTVPVNTRGELYLRSPGMFKEYFNDPEKTKAVMTVDGWYKSDDIGRMNEKGEFFVEGRKSNMIISGGMNVAPEILEQVVKTLPGVASAVIVPVPDDDYYQVICACVVTKPGLEITEEQLQQSVEDFHTDKPGLFTVLPKFYLILEKLPETNTGKIDRKEIERMACSKFM